MEPELSMQHIKHVISEFLFALCTKYGHNKNKLSAVNNGWMITPHEEQREAAALGFVDKIPGNLRNH